MSANNGIADLLAQILAAVYGRDVRQSIHDAIEQCYTDVTDGVTLAQTAAAAANSAAANSETRTTAAIGTMNTAVTTAVSSCTTATAGANTAASNANAMINRFDISLSSIALMEPTGTAIMAHAVDSYFYLNGVLYVTKSPIAVGDTITNGVNCQPVVLIENLPSTEDDLAYISAGSDPSAPDAITVLIDSMLATADDVAYITGA